ncbi:MAG: hypothetical protein LIP12_06545 [Clostridiales bacterium]|nr:hypothetical protein [Clostridiales bacterium]
MNQTCPYIKNPFCSSLSVFDRRALCPNCHLFKFKKNQDVDEMHKEMHRKMDSLKPFEYVTLMIKGCICTSKSADYMPKQAFLLWEKGDIIHAENIMPESDPLIEIWRYYILTEGCFAAFEAKIIKDLFLHSSTFSVAVFKSVIKTREGQSKFLLGTQLQNARQAIMFVLIYGKENHYPPLSHQQIAYLCGLDRTTVTKTMKKIMQEEDLDISLQEYIKKIYN